MCRYGTTVQQFAKIAEKNHAHSVNNPYAQFQDRYSLEEILAAKMIAEPLTVRGGGRGGGRRGGGEGGGEGEEGGGHTYLSLSFSLSPEATV